MLEAIRGRLADCGLELHPTKTRIATARTTPAGEHEHIAFDFLGYTFQPRRAKNRWGRYFVSFLPAIGAQGRDGDPADRFPQLADGVHQE